MAVCARWPNRWFLGFVYMGVLVAGLGAGCYFLAPSVGDLGDSQGVAAAAASVTLIVAAGVGLPATAGVVGWIGRVLRRPFIALSFDVGVDETDLTPVEQNGDANVPGGVFYIRLAVVNSGDHHRAMGGSASLFCRSCGS